jgi:hypothetical protein
MKVETLRRDRRAEVQLTNHKTIPAVEFDLKAVVAATKRYGEEKGSVRAESHSTAPQLLLVALFPLPPPRAAFNSF